MNRSMRPGDVFNSGVFIALAVVFLFVSIVAAVAVPIAVSSTPPHPLMARAGVAKRSGPASCVTGEDWDREVELCAPRFHAPLAFEGSIMDGSQTPCGGSFYHMMCGKWIGQHTNENRAFSFAHRRIQARLKRLVQREEGPLQNFYLSCMARGSDAAAQETKLIYQHLLGRVMEPVRAHADLPHALGVLARMGYTGLFAMSVEKHPLEARVVPLWMSDNFPESVLNEQGIYQALALAREVTNYNIEQEQHMILGVLAIARALREARTFAMEDQETLADYAKTHLARHLTTWRALGEGTSFAWDRFLQALGGPGLRFGANQTMWVPDLAYMRRVTSAEFIAQFTVPQWRSWLTFSVLYNAHQMEPELPSNVYFRRHDHQGPLGRGHHLSSRLRRRTDPSQADCTAIAIHMLPGVAAASYLNTFMANRERDRKEVRGMVEALRAELRAAVLANTWLSEADRIVLARKINATLVRVAEPDLWEPEPFAASISADRYDYNLNLVRAYRVERGLSMWKAAPYEAPAWDRNALATFASPLFAVNAYYSGTSNSITILAGLMQHPFYAADYGVVSKFAIMGSVIGHELSHMLDHHGLYWDEHGNFRPDGILSPAGMQRFYNASDCVIEQYGPAPAGCEREGFVYGNATAGEDLADLTGIKVAFRALSRFAPATTLGDKQHFFMVLAQAFCETYDQDHLCDAVVNDVHAVAEFRIDRTYRNLPDFHATFQCHQGQPMWRNDSEVCAVY